MVTYFGSAHFGLSGFRMAQHDQIWLSLRLYALSFVCWIVLLQQPSELLTIWSTRLRDIANAHVALERLLANGALLC